MHYNDVNKHNRQTKHVNCNKRQHMIKYWSDSLCPQWSRQAVITVSRSTRMTTKMNGVATNLFYTGVIGPPRCNVFKLGTKISNLKQYNWSTKMVRKF